MNIRSNSALQNDFVFKLGYVSWIYISVRLLIPLCKVDPRRRESAGLLRATHLRGGDELHRGPRARAGRQQLRVQCAFTDGEALLASMESQGIGA